MLPSQDLLVSGAAPHDAPAVNDQVVAAPRPSRTLASTTRHRLSRAGSDSHPLRGRPRSRRFIVDMLTNLSKTSLARWPPPTFASSRRSPARAPSASDPQRLRSSENVAPATSCVPPPLTQPAPACRRRRQGRRGGYVVTNLAKTPDMRQASPARPPVSPPSLTP